MLKATNGYDQKWLYYMRKGSCGAEILEQDGTHVFDLVTVENSTAHRDLEQNVERLVSCAAKFNQMSTDDIKKMPLSVKGVIAQRDELLAQLRELVQQVQGFQDCNGDKGFVLTEALAVIANASGPEPYVTDDVCPNCNGSGEGMYAGTRCGSCKGSGVERTTSGEDE